jgi:hypothetical protein
VPATEDQQKNTIQQVNLITIQVQGLVITIHAAEMAIADILNLIILTIQEAIHLLAEAVQKVIHRVQVPGAAVPLKDDPVPIHQVATAAVPAAATAHRAVQGVSDHQAVVAVRVLHLQEEAVPEAAVVEVAGGKQELTRILLIYSPLKNQYVV